MGQVSEEFDHNPSNVRSRCILIELYKAKKHVDQGGRKNSGREIKERKEPSHCTFLLRLNPRTNN